MIILLIRIILITFKNNKKSWLLILCIAIIIILLFKIWNKMLNYKIWLIKWNFKIRWKHGIEIYQVIGLKIWVLKIYIYWMINHIFIGKKTIRNKITLLQYLENWVFFILNWSLKLLSFWWWRKCIDLKAILFL